jgi:peptide/nickel transport system substrate-binding protein
VLKLAKVLTVVAALAVPTFLASCGGGTTTQEGGEAKVSVSSYPDYLDPQLSYTVEGWEALWLTYTPLLTYKHEPGDAGVEVIPGLAEDLPDISSDGKTYTLQLRDGIKYSDGSAIKASDFKYAVERAFDVNSGGTAFYTKIDGAEDYQSGKAKEISGIEADDKTGEITIELTEPSGTFNNELGLMFVAPVPQDTPKDKDQTKDPPPATGPYEITEVDPGRTFTMKKNPEFKTVTDAGADIPEAQVDTINVEEIKNLSSQVTDVEQNRLDFMIDNPPADRLSEIESRYSDRFRRERAINTYYMWMNTEEPPFDDVKVRQAVNYAIDPEAIAKFYGGLMTPTQQILPEGIPGYEEYELYPGPDLDKAKQLIKQANPSDTDITVWTDDEEQPKRTGAYYQDLLNQLGFNAELKVISGDVYFQTIGNEKTPNLDTGFTDWFQDYPHPNDFFDPLLNGENIIPENNQNFGYVDIPELNKEITKLGKEQLSDDVEQQYADLDRKYMEQAVWAPYGVQEWSTFTSDRLDFDQVYFHLLFQQDWTSFALTE